MKKLLILYFLFYVYLSIKRPPSVFLILIHQVRTQAQEVGDLQIIDLMKKKAM